MVPMCDNDDCPDLDLLELGLGHDDITAARAAGGPFSRRRLMQAGSAAAALAFFGASSAPSAVADTVAAGSGLVLPGGMTSTRHAMHVHSSPSEGRGSFANQVALAESSGCDYLWMTEHDWRLWALPGDDRITRSYAFTSLDAANWHWKPVSAGSASSKRADIVPYAGSKALELQVTAGGAATYGLKATTSSHRLEGSVIGRQVFTPATVTALSGEAYFEIALMFSNHGAHTPQKLVYRYGTSAAGRRKVNASTGQVYIPVKVGDTISAPVSPVDDLRYFFGTTSVAEDNSIVAVQLQVTANAGSVTVVLPRLDLPRNVTGQAAFDAVARMYDDVLVGHRSLTVRRAIEVSGNEAHHLGWYGDDATNLVVAAGRAGIGDAIAQIRRHGSVASFNHPYGTAPKPRDPAKILDNYARLVTSLVYGADVLELGYDVRAGMTLEDHLALGDLLWCDGVVITANGVSDDHNGNSWRESFLTQLWGDGTQASELDALKSGRATMSRVGWSGDLWLTLDGRPMGSVPTTSQRGTGELEITATDLPAGSSIQVVRGTIDPQGARRTRADLTVTTIPAAQVSGAVARLSVPGGNAFFRAMVVDRSGSIRQFTNPVWSGVPATSVVPPSRRVPV